MRKNAAVHGTNSRYTSGCRCDECRSARAAYARQHYSANREAIAAKRRERNPDTLSRKNERIRNYEARTLAAHGPGPSATQRITSDAWEIVVAQRIQEVMKTLREQARAYGGRRRARLDATAHGCVTPSSIDALIRATLGRCVYCGDDFAHMDHVHPLSKGGLHCVENLVPACASCNLRKNAKILDNPPAPLLRCPERDLQISEHP